MQALLSGVDREAKSTGGRLSHRGAYGAVLYEQALAEALATGSRPA